MSCKKVTNFISIVAYFAESAAEMWILQNLGMSQTNLGVSIFWGLQNHSEMGEDKNLAYFLSETTQLNID